MTLLPIIEKLSIVAPLGLCFHDVATGERINEGLNVSVYPVTTNARKKRASAFANRSGVYVLYKAPGLEDFINGAGDAEFWEENTPQKSYVVEVSDNEKRFQSFQFTIELPVKNIYQWENIPVASPNKNLASVPVYSAPTRKISGGMSVVRATLRDASDVPAAWAVLEARFEGNLVARGIADQDGQIVLIFPTLAPQSDPLISPPATATQISLAEQNWILDLTVKYEPDIFQSSPPVPAESDEEVFPDLRLALAQAPGKLWADVEQTEEYETATLNLGRELILRSRAAEVLSPMPDSATVFSSYLFVSPAI
jgi:hypothetical protein